MNGNGCINEMHPTINAPHTIGIDYYSSDFVAYAPVPVSFSNFKSRSISSIDRLSRFFNPTANTSPSPSAPNTLQISQE